MLYFLDEKNPGSRVIAVAGMHTGRRTVAGFWETAQRLGFEIEYLTEKDVDFNQRDFEADRGIEDVVERKRWFIIRILKKGVKLKRCFYKACGELSLYAVHIVIGIAFSIYNS